VLGFELFLDLGGDPMILEGKHTRPLQMGGLVHTLGLM